MEMGREGKGGGTEFIHGKGSKDRKAMLVEVIRLTEYSSEAKELGGDSKRRWVENEQTLGWTRNYDRETGERGEMRSLISAG